MTKKTLRIAKREAKRFLERVLTFEDKMHEDKMAIYGCAESGAVMKMPSFQFYPADWLNNIKLQSCSLEAQGLLINLMCLMHQAKPYGYLLVNGSYPLNKTVARLLRLHSKTYDKTLIELISSGVLSTNEKGVIYCGRMVKDEQIREVRREAGKLGGNPLLKQKVKQTAKQKTTPSSSSSSSPSPSNKKTFEAFWETYPKRVGKEAAFKAWKTHKCNEITAIIIKSVKAHINSKPWKKDEGEFIPHPTTFLNQHRWDDEVEMPKITRQSTMKSGSSIVEKWKKDAEGGN